MLYGWVKSRAGKHPQVSGCRKTIDAARMGKEQSREASAGIRMQEDH